MLRRSTNFILPTAVVATSTIASAASLAASARNVFAFSEQSAALANAAKHLKYKSNVWVEIDKDAYWYSKRTALKSDNEKPTETTLERLIEYYNGDCLANRGDQQLVEDMSRASVKRQNAGGKQRLGDASVNEQLSYSSGKPFSDKVAKQLSQVAGARQYKSNVWIPVSMVRSKNLELQRYARPTHIIVATPGKFVNADQFQDPAAIAKAPLSAYKRAPYGGETSEALAKEIKKHNFETGLFFTQSQLETFGLTDKIKAGAIPVQIALDSNNRGNNSNNTPKDVSSTLYNITDVEGAEKLVADLNRFPVDVPTYLVSGKPVVQPEVLAAVKASPAGAKSNYWMSQYDITSRNLKLKDSAVGVSSSFTIGGNKNKESKDGEKKPNVVAFYSVHDLEVPALGFKVAGTKATNYAPSQ